MIIGICMTKDEKDIIRTTVEHMLTQVDAVIVADNNSTDGTRDILSELPITLIDDPDPAYYQSKKMTNLAKVARNMGAEWVVPFDSDEIWYSPFGTIKEVLSKLQGYHVVANADLYDHVSSSDDDLTELNPVKRIGWRRSYFGALPKVACRWDESLVIQQGNHSAQYAFDIENRKKEGLLVIRHFPYRSSEQFVSKVRNGAAAYAATDLPEHSGAHWRGYGSVLESKGEEALVEEVYKTWFYLNNPTQLDDVVYDPAPIVL